MKAPAGTALEFPAEDDALTGVTMEFVRELELLCDIDELCACFAFLDGGPGVGSGLLAA